MGQFNILVIRLILGAVFAVILSRFFFKDFNIIYTAGLAIFLVGLAYVFEYFRTKK